MAASGAASRRLWMAVVLLLPLFLFAGNLYYNYPGTLNADSRLQLAQIASGRYQDWHPPAMTYYWALLLKLPHRSPSAPFVTVDLVGYWLAFAIISACVLASGRRVSALLCCAAGATPLFMMLNITVGKDVLFTAAMLLGFSLLLAEKVFRPRAELALRIVGIALILFAVLMRHNGLFALGPMLAFALEPDWLRRPVRLCVGSVALGALLVPVTGFINHDLLHARDARPIASLEYFDLAGLAERTRNPALLGPASRISQSDIDHCFSVVMWDTLSPWGRCPWFTTRAGDPVAGDAPPIERSPSLGRLWASAVVHHPADYGLLRLRHFNSELYLFVPDAHTEDVRHNPKDDIHAKTYRGSRAFYFFRYSPLFAPAWLAALGATIFITLALLTELPSTPLRAGALALTGSGTIYALSYLVLGVATDSRYFFLTSAAALIAAILMIGDPQVRAALRQRRGLAVLLLLPPLATLSLCFAGRVLLPMPVYVPYAAPSHT